MDYHQSDSLTPSGLRSCVSLVINELTRKYPQAEPYLVGEEQRLYEMIGANRRLITSKSSDLEFEIEQQLEAIAYRTPEIFLRMNAYRTAMNNWSEMN